MTNIPRTTALSLSDTDRLHCSYGELNSDVLGDIERNAVAFCTTGADRRLGSDEERRYLHSNCRKVGGKGQMVGCIGP